ELHHQRADRIPGWAHDPTGDGHAVRPEPRRPLTQLLAGLGLGWAAMHVPGDGCREEGEPMRARHRARLECRSVWRAEKSGSATVVSRGWTRRGDVNASSRRGRPRMA